MARAAGSRLCNAKMPRTPKTPRGCKKIETAWKAKPAMKPNCGAKFPNRSSNAHRHHNFHRRSARTTSESEGLAQQTCRACPHLSLQVYTNDCRRAVPERYPLPVMSASLYPVPPTDQASDWSCWIHLTTPSCTEQVWPNNSRCCGPRVRYVAQSSFRDHRRSAFPGGPNLADILPDVVECCLILDDCEFRAKSG